MPDELPSNEDGVGLLPSTVIVKSDGSASPPPSLITCLVTNNVPGCDALLESPFDVGTGVGAGILSSSSSDIVSLSSSVS